MTDPALKRAADPVPEEAELVARAKAGDHAAYEALVRRYEHLAFRAAFLVVRSAVDAEDVAQEAFVKAYRALGRFRTGAEFRPWLLRIVGNEARNHRRAARRRSLYHERVGRLGPPIEHPAPDDELVRREEVWRVLAALERLPEGERTAILARYFVGLSDAEAASALGLPRTAVKMRAWRGLQRLRRELAEDAT